MKKIFIDGYNLIHSIPTLKNQLNYNLESARDGLIDLLYHYKKRKKTDITVVFDGWPGFMGKDDNVKGIRVHFSHAPEKADQVIKRLIGQYERDKGILVVSSDREIFDYSRVCGLKSIRSENFAEKLLSLQIKSSALKKNKKKSDPMMSEEELQEWMDLFGC
ncbi:MAG: NYN domain-containing protein [bacterium]